MSHTTAFKGSALTLVGQELRAGQALPGFRLVANDMSEFSSDSLKGKKLIICSVPSLDTPVCEVETLRFNQEVSKLAGNIELLVVSRDLPFAQKRWCGLNDTSRVRALSDFRHSGFAESFGVEIKEWGLLARAVFVADENGQLVHVQYVPEVSAEPDYEAVLKALN